jgi:hypothetical protein
VETTDLRASVAAPNPVPWDYAKKATDVIKVALGVILILGGLFLFYSVQKIFSQGALTTGTKLAGGVLITSGFGLIMAGFGLLHCTIQREDPKPSTVTLAPQASRAVVLPQTIPKARYTTAASKNRAIPALCGYNGFSPDHFDLLMPGIAVCATLLSQKHRLQNLWVCKGLVDFQRKLVEIQNTP